MLTKNDLGQIRDVVREEVKVAKDELKSEIKALEKRTDKKLKKMTNSILNYHDEHAIYLRKRIEKLEEHTGILKS